MAEKILNITECKQVTIPETVFADLVTQNAILNKIYSDINNNNQMSFIHKKLLLKNKKINDELMLVVEELCKTL